MLLRDFEKEIKLNVPLNTNLKFVLVQWGDISQKNILHINCCDKFSNVSQD